jgi:HSP20 family protein
MLPTLWEPFDTMRSMDREFNEIVNRFFSTLPEEARSTMAWRPSVEIFRDDDDLVVRADLPGIDPDKDIELSIEGNVLHMKGHRSFDREVSDEHRYVVERAYGEFRRELALPEGVDADKMKATYDDGVLTVTVPLPDTLKATEPKAIPIAVSKVKKLFGGGRNAG